MPGTGLPLPKCLQSPSRHLKVFLSVYAEQGGKAGFHQKRLKQVESDKARQTLKISQEKLIKAFV